MLLCAVSRARPLTRKKRPFSLRLFSLLFDMETRGSTIVYFLARNVLSFFPSFFWLDQNSKRLRKFYSASIDSFDGSFSKWSGKLFRLSARRAACMQPSNERVEAPSNGWWWFRGRKNSFITPWCANGFFFSFFFKGPLKNFPARSVYSTRVSIRSKDELTKEQPRSEIMRRVRTRQFAAGSRTLIQKRERERVREERENERGSEE